MIDLLQAVAIFDRCNGLQFLFLFDFLEFLFIFLEFLSLFFRNELYLHFIIDQIIILARLNVFFYIRLIRKFIVN